MAWNDFSKQLQTRFNELMKLSENELKQKLKTLIAEKERKTNYKIVVEVKVEHAEPIFKLENKETGQKYMKAGYPFNFWISDKEAVTSKDLIAEAICLLEEEIPLEAPRPEVA